MSIRQVDTLESEANLKEFRARQQKELEETQRGGLQGELLEFRDVEALVLSRLSELKAARWAKLPSGQQWCVGGSIAASYRSRLPTASGLAKLHFRFCPTTQAPCGRSLWTGKHPAKLGNTCESHSTILLTDVRVVGTHWQTLEMSKCCWLRVSARFTFQLNLGQGFIDTARAVQCCYGRKPYASPPEMPWSAPCAQRERFGAAETATASRKPPPQCVPTSPPIDPITTPQPDSSDCGVLVHKLI